MKRSWTLREVANATGGRLHGDPAAVAQGVSVDSRTVARGELFVAVAGESFDGHDYAGRAVASGAAAVLVEREQTAGLPRIEVDNTLRALRDLAVFERSRMRNLVLAITGSTGKTSTKDLLTAALGHQAWGSPRSFNNEIGVPLTILNAPAEVSHVVAEVGSRGAGQIDWLAPAIEPDVAVITNIGQVHLEAFGSVEELVKGKWELVAALHPGGVAVLPAGDDRLLSRGHDSVVTFGQDPSTADVAAIDVSLDELARPRFRLVTTDGEAPVSLQLAGLHQALNAAAAAAAALAVDQDLGDIADRLSEARGSAWRFEVHDGAFRVVNDAYNANPTSMEAALRSAVSLGQPRIAVLGLMAELGEVSAAEHRRIGRLAADLGYDPIIVVGADDGLAEGAGTAAVPVPDADAALAVLAEAATPGAVVLVKASRVVGLEHLADRLAAGAAS